MRLYSLLFGTLLTVGSVSVTGLALDSARPDRQGLRSTLRDSIGAGRVWYGGKLAPITVTARGPETTAVAAEPVEAAARFTKHGRRGE